MSEMSITSYRVAGAAAVASAAAAAAVMVGAGPASAAVAEPDEFSSAFTVAASPDGVVDAAGEQAPGEPGASGSATLRVNAALDVICWDVSVRGVAGPLDDEDGTSMSILEAPAGFAGPSRIAVPDPEGDDALRTGSGCAKGPFVGSDGESFSVASLEADPASYSWDLRSEAYPAGAIRGQLVRVPVTGPHAGFGGAQADPTATARYVGAGASVGVALLAGTILVRRRRARA